MESDETMRVLEWLARRRGSVGSIWKFLARNPPLARALGGLGEYLRFDGALGPQTRERIILSVAARERCPYVWSHHVMAARHAGLTDDDLRAIEKEAGASSCVGLDLPQRIEAVVLEGYYKTICAVIREFDVRLEDTAVEGD